MKRERERESGTRKERIMVEEKKKRRNGKEC